MFNNLFQKYITTKNIIFFIIAVLFIIFISKIQDIAILFFASYVIACSLNPLVDKLSKKFNRNAASLIVLVGAIVIICAFFVPLLALGIHEIKSFADSLPQLVEIFKQNITQNHLFAKLNLNDLDLSDFLSSTSGFTSGLVNSSINIGKNIGTAFIYLIISIIITFYFMSDKDTVRKTYLSLFPSNMQEKAGNIMSSISEKIGGYVVAQLATMASVGIVMAIGLAICGVEYAILIGLITSVLDIIPIIGPAIALILALIVSCKSGIFTIACVIGVFAVAQLIENNFVRPYVFSKFLNLHPLIIYLFLLIAAKYLGIIGVLFAPAIAATVVVLVEELYIKSMK
jgi:predicted PurR-regulated permease PerM